MSDSPIKFVQVKCPNCNAVMNLEDYRTTAFCSYCGTRLLIHRQNEQIVHTIDEAEIKKAETDRDIKIKELEIEKEKNKNDTRFISGVLIGCVVIFVLCFIFLGLMTLLNS